MEIKHIDNVEEIVDRLWQIILNVNMNKVLIL